MKKNDPIDSLIDRSLNYGRHHIRRFLEHPDVRGSRVVLDLGAGTGVDLAIARSVLPDASLHGVEVFPEYQQLLRDKGIIVHGLNIEKDPLPFDAESVDVVMANQVLEHLKETFWVLHESSRVLRTGGTLILGVPNLASLHNRLLLLAGRQPTCIQNASAHVRGFTRRDLLHLLDACFPAGYRLRMSGGSNFYPFPPFLARPFAAALPGMAWGIFFSFTKLRPYQREFIDYPVLQQLETNFHVGDTRNPIAAH